MSRASTRTPRIPGRAARKARGTPRRGSASAGPGERQPAHGGDDEPRARQRVWQAIAAIPPGQVATYGTVAALAGVPRGARFVGTVLRELPAGSRLPWHRVLNASGRLGVDPLTALEQRERLEAEGVVFVNARVDLSRFGWGR